MYLVERGLAMKRIRHGQYLENRIVGVYFLQTSTRTRTSFIAGALKLRAGVIAYSPGDLQTNTGETIVDTVRVLCESLDALVVRGPADVESLRQLACQSQMAVINAMSKDEHPTQAIADLTTMFEHFGHLADLHVLYVGEGNNTASALALAVSRVPGMRLSLVTPRSYGVPECQLNAARAFCRTSGAHVDESHDPVRLPSNVDVVYATRWQTTGSTKPEPNWRQAFEGFSVTESMMERVGRPGRTVFMHDLPAVRGEDVAGDILDGPSA